MEQDKKQEYKLIYRNGHFELYESGSRRKYPKYIKKKDKIFYVKTTGMSMIYFADICKTIKYLMNNIIDWKEFWRRKYQIEEAFLDFDVIKLEGYDKQKHIEFLHGLCDSSPFMIDAYVDETVPSIVWKK